MPRQERFDGFDIDDKQARFVGTFDLDDSDVAAIEFDRVVFMVVSARVGGAGIKTTKSGDIKRIDVLSVQEVRVAEGAMRDKCVDFLMGKSNQPSLFVEQHGIATPEQKAEELAFVQANGNVETPEDEFLTPSSQDEGTKVGKIDLGDDGSPDLVEREVVGEVYPRQRKDEALTRFMQDF